MHRDVALMVGAEVNGHHIVRRAMIRTIEVSLYSFMLQHLIFKFLIKALHPFSLQLLEMRFWILHSELIKQVVCVRSQTHYYLTLSRKQINLYFWQFQKHQQGAYEDSLKLNILVYGLSIGKTHELELATNRLTDVIVDSSYENCLFKRRGGVDKL